MGGEIVIRQLGIVAVLTAIAATHAAAAGEATTALQVCGTLKQHRPATATAAGSVTIGTKTYAVAPGATAGNAGVSIEIGRDLCLQAALGRTTQQLLQYLFFWMPRERFCGNGLTSTADTSTIAADFGELTLRRGAVVPAPQGRERVCYAFQLESGSGDLVATSVLPVRDIDRERISSCGTVKAYARSTSASSGSIEIGSRGYRIAAGVAYTGDPAGSREDRTAVGQEMCLRATLGTAGEVLEYLTSEMHTTLSGTAYAYTPPTGTQPGVLILSYGSRAQITIQPTIDAAADLSRGVHCFRTTVDAAGDMSAATLTQPCPPSGGVTGPVGTEPSPSPTPTPTAITTSAPSPSPATATIAAAPAATGSAPPAAAGSPSVEAPSPSASAGIGVLLVLAVVGLLGAAVLIARRS